MAATSQTGDVVTKNDKLVLNRVFNPNLPNDDDEEIDEPTADMPILLTDSEKRAKQLELEGVEAAEKGDTNLALEKFDAAIVMAPHQPSGYNNRAQAMRLKGDDQAALEDLNYAIELSHGKGQAVCQAYTQRGLLKKKAGDEEGALEDFKMAASMGSKFAKQIVIMMNPYAALCNQMLTEVVCKLKAGLPIE